MVGGLDKFKTFFSPYKEQYVLIGGAACDLILDELATSFRATKDLDIVLIVEALTPEFGQTFWNFIQEGKYRNKSISTENPHFYRFDKPEASGYPYMIELFSRNNFTLNLPDSLFTPIHFNDDISSLSAILLDDVYYEMLLAGRKEVDDIIVLAPEYIIPFKAKAWLDLTKKKQRGGSVDEKDIKKHRNDIVRLTAILTNVRKLPIFAAVMQDMASFIEQLEENPIDTKSLHIGGITIEQILARLKEMYL